MFVYRFTLNENKCTITKRIIECDEKPKTYQPMRKEYTSRINKSDIGVVGSRFYHMVDILEDDFEKAKELLVADYKNKISNKKFQIKSIQYEVDKMEKKLDYLEKITESTGE